MAKIGGFKLQAVWLSVENSVFLAKVVECLMEILMGEYISKRIDVFSSNVSFLLQERFLKSIHVYNLY